jgi:NADH dehydrogenase [ubiquinone] 1 alpha subcomplex assembly factor 5
MGAWDSHNRDEECMTAEPPGIEIFDRGLVRRRRERAAAGFDAVDFLAREVAERLAERLDGIERRFPLVLDLGCHTGQLGRALVGRGGIETLISADLAAGMAARAGRPALAADEELLPFAHGRLDLIASCLSLHWVNDLPGALAQIRAALRPDGLFLAALFGVETLRELKDALLETEATTGTGVAPHVSPMVDLRDAAGLLQRAGFALPVADCDTITVSYASPLALLADLRAMGEANAAVTRSRAFWRRDVLARALALYAERHADGGGRVPATFQIVYLTGWAPAPGQQQPRRPGSAHARLADALGARERSAGEKAGR